MTEDDANSVCTNEVARYNKAMYEGRYLDGLDIVLRANAPEGISDEELYAPILDKLWPLTHALRDEDN